VDELLVFAHARLVEEEQAALWAVRNSSIRERGLGEIWEVVRTGPELRELVIQTRPKAFRPHRVVGGLDPLLDKTVAAHIANHDTARTLRDVQARRKTLVRCQEEMLSGIPRLVHFAKMTAWEMAQRWSDHKAFNEGWKP
jgi:hypothetical protein